MSRPLRVGIVGANAHRGWARDAHYPALANLSQFILVAVSARSDSLAKEAKAAFGAHRAYADSFELVRAEDVDVVVVTVRVPEHRAIVLAALDAGKHVYCEWPLGRDLAESQEMAAAVKIPGQRVMIGLQGLSAPPIRHAARLISQGAIGQPRVLRVFSPTAGWGSSAAQHYAYLQDRRFGATLETIAGGHTLAALEALVGPYLEIDARCSTFATSVQIQGSTEVVQRTCADHVMILGKHASGCVSTAEVIGGVTSQAFELEIMGERGSIRVTGGRAGGYQVGNLRLQTDAPNEVVPALLRPALEDTPAAYIAEAYARFADLIRTGTGSVPDFKLAARLTLLLDSVALAAQTGTRQQMTN